MIRMRLDTSSGLPFGTAEREEVDLAGREVEDGGARRAVQPAARLARADEERAAARARLLPVLAAEHDDVVRLERARGGLAEVVHEEQARAPEDDAVRAVEQLRGEAAGGAGHQPVAVAVVAAEDAHDRERHLALERAEQEGRTEVAGVE